MGKAILDAFAAPEWRAIDDRWVRREIPTSVRARAQFALVDADRCDLDDFVRAHRIDAAFPELAAELRARGAEVRVVSDGFDYYVRPMLVAAGAQDVPFVANRMAFRDGAIELEVPHEAEGCGHCGVCKGAQVRSAQAAGRRVAFVGDGVSDRHAADQAQVVFARHLLAEYCEARGIPYHSFASIADVHAWVIAHLPELADQAVAHE